MATVKISELPAILGSNTAATDVIPIVDVSGNITNKITRAEFFKNVPDMEITDKIIHSGDTNTAIRFPANDTVTVETNGLERLRVTSAGFALLGQSAITNPGVSNTTTGISISPAGTIWASADAAGGLNLNRNANGSVAAFRQSGATVGSISVTDSATAYNTSSDYRLKEDVQPMVGSADRLMALKPVNFAWKRSGSRVDGFLAHEAQEVVPEAVTGEKDGEDMQAIDHSKLVPLLTSALQEALQKIEALEARITTLEASLVIPINNPDNN
jgi:hypothetical protein